jgi:hypothetical protein
VDRIAQDGSDYVSPAPDWYAQLTADATEPLVWLEDAGI